MIDEILQGLLVELRNRVQFLSVKCAAEAETIGDHLRVTYRAKGIEDAIELIEQTAKKHADLNAAFMRSAGRKRKK